MGNEYRIVADIELTCRLHTRPGIYAIQVSTGDDVNVFTEKVKQVLGCNNARDIVLWKTEIPNELEDAFMNLVLVEGDNLTKFTKGELNNFWKGDLGQTLEGHTHIIIESPYLVLKQEKDDEIDGLRDEIERLRRLQIQGNNYFICLQTMRHIFHEISNNTDKLTHVDYSYEIPDKWTSAKAKPQDLCSAKIISVDHGKLAIICYDVLPDYEAHIEVLANGNLKKDLYPDLDEYMGNFSIRDDLEIEGKKLEDISSLPELEENYSIYIKFPKIIGLDDFITPIEIKNYT
ncbi:hypothetical protein RhiirA5_405892 [Rhizophagus irregularis]|uniref:Uncharacterized protein n=1 Tax=Rhizophagus irregularis TaxID=588596 RepID=A0A2N0QED1_9GLOM|nr:hypothetical protein RhiirA5_405892 [Rhizophagus irregularis]